MTKILTAFSPLITQRDFIILSRLFTAHFYFEENEEYLTQHTANILKNNK